MYWIQELRCGVRRVCQDPGHLTVRDAVTAASSDRGTFGERPNKSYSPNSGSSTVDGAESGQKCPVEMLLSAYTSPVGSWQAEPCQELNTDTTAA